MFDFAWSELALIAVVALVIIGPKDMPRVMRIVGQWVRQARSIAREFQGSVDQMMRESELDEVKRHIDRATSFNVENEIRRAVDPGGELQHSLSEPVLTNPLADPPKPVERIALDAPLEPKPAQSPETSPNPAIPAPLAAGEHGVPPALDQPQTESGKGQPEA
ncbi:MAG TPA: Sec-independent protein translocase protein TatB [Stellaceae bacterium]|nr:Sec-independent protein translocase protein TatB [Stellaceae bacterium]